MKKKKITLLIFLFIFIIFIIVFFIPKSLPQSIVFRRIERITNNYKRNSFETINSFPDMKFTYEYDRQTMQQRNLKSTDKGTWYVTKKGKGETLSLEITTKWQIGTVGNNNIKYYIDNNKYLFLCNGEIIEKDEGIWKSEVTTYFISLLSPSKNENFMLDVNLLSSKNVETIKQGFNTTYSINENNISLTAVCQIGQKYFKSIDNIYTIYENYQLSERIYRKYTFKY